MNDSGIILRVLIKSVMFQSRFLLNVIRLFHARLRSLRSDFAFRSGSGYADQSIHHFLLIFVQCVPNIANSFNLRIIRFFIRLGLSLSLSSSFFFGHFSVFLLFSMFNCFSANRLTSPKIDFVIRHFSMSDHVFNRCTRIRTSKHKAHFTNSTMQNICANLLYLICTDRKADNIAMLYKIFCILPLLGIIKVTESKNTVLYIFQLSFTKNAKRARVIMVPDKRYFFPVVVFKRIMPNNSAVRAFQIVLRGPTPKVALRDFHFEVFLLI